MCAKRGRKKAFTPKDYLDAVKQTRSMDDNKIASVIGVDRSNIYRFRTKDENKDTVIEAKKIIAKYAELIHIKSITDYNTFLTIPIIEDWIKILTDKRRSLEYRNKLTRYLFNLCNYKNIHPQKLTLEVAKEVNDEMKGLYWDDKPQPKGLGYTSLREAIRSFFMIMHKVSAEYLSSIGITKEASKGQGRYAKLRVSQNVRHKLEETLKPLVNDYQEYIECLAVNKFMYYTATRINATLEIDFTINDYNLKKDVWIFEVIDKGEHATGRIKWNKTLTDHALDSMKEYCSERFNIPIDELEGRLPHITNKLFPTLNDSRMAELNKEGLIKAGLQYRKFPPNHIWRHTFAQDFLDTSDPPNYELCAELGGWTNSGVLKKHYGKMSEESKIRGLRISMGIKLPEKERKVLKW